MSTLRASLMSLRCSGRLVWNTLIGMQPKCCSRTPTTPSSDQRHHLQISSRANIHSSREPLGLYRSDGRRPDGVTLTPWRVWKCLIWDATSPDTQAASHINGTSQKAGATAEQAANQKTDKYRKLSSKYFFIPVAVETLGPINADGANFLSELGRRIEQSSMEKLETAHLFVRISIAVQRG